MAGPIRPSRGPAGEGGVGCTMDERAVVVCIGVTAELGARVVRSAGQDAAIVVVSDVAEALRVLHPRSNGVERPLDGRQGERSVGRPAGEFADPVRMGLTVPSMVTAEPGRSNGRTVQFGPLQLRPTTREASWQEHRIELSAQQFDLLRTLAADTERVWSHADLTRAVWRRPYVGDSDAVVSAIKRLRRRLSAVTNELRVASIRGVGYRLRLGEIGVSDSPTVSG